MRKNFAMAANTTALTATASAEADRWAVEFDAGTVPNETNVVISVTGLTPNVYRFGGDVDSAGKRYEANEVANAFAQTGVPHYVNHTVHAGVLKKISYYTSAATTETLDIYKNGAISESPSLAATGFHGVWKSADGDFTELEFADGDTIGFEMGTASWNDSRLDAYLE